MHRKGCAAFHEFLWARCSIIAETLASVIEFSNNLVAAGTEIDFDDSRDWCIGVEGLRTEDGGRVKDGTHGSYLWV